MKGMFHLEGQDDHKVIMQEQLKLTIVCLFVHEIRIDQSQSHLSAWCSHSPRWYRTHPTHPNPSL
jgi:hypothetical protein